MAKKRILTILTMASCVWTLCAQEPVSIAESVERQNAASQIGGARSDLGASATSVSDFSAPVVPEIAAPAGFRADSLAMSFPLLTSRGTISHYPYYGSLLSGYGDWALHQGFNASLSASAIFGLGHHSGSGFAHSLSVMYADNITPKLSFALGGYYSFLDWSGARFNDAGLTAMLSYRFDEHWEASAFVQKSMMKSNLPPHLYWMSDVGDKIGASVRYNFNPQFSVSVSVWNENRPNFYGPIPPSFPGDRR